MIENKLDREGVTAALAAFTFWGLATVLPLIWFNMAAKKLPLSILGFFQYIAPSMSFLLAVYLFNETFTHGHAVAFGCIWLALALVSIEPFQRVRRRLHG